MFKNHHNIHVSNDFVHDVSYLLPVLCPYKLDISNTIYQSRVIKKEKKLEDF